MTTPIPRVQVRAMLESHVSRHAQACVEGRWNAVKLDIDDELNDAYRFIFARFGVLAAEQFKRMYAEEELAFILDLQAYPQAMRRRILPNWPQHVVTQSQLPRQRWPNGSAVIVLAVLFFLGMLTYFC